MGDIFQWIEKKMNIVVPAYVKNILKCCGYDTCHAIATIVDRDVEYLADQVRNGSVHNYYRAQINEEAVMEGCTCTTSIEKFNFSRGHIKLLQAMAKIVKEILETYGVDGFIMKPQKNLPQHRQEKDSSAARAVPVYRKRFKFSTETPQSDVNVSSNDLGDDTILPSRPALIKKIVLSLATHTPKLFADVSKSKF